MLLARSTDSSLPPLANLEQYQQNNKQKFLFLKPKVMFQANYIKGYKLSGGVHIGENVHTVLPLLNNSEASSGSTMSFWVCH